MLKKSKQAQMQIQEMSFMIIALAIFFILVLLFYLAVSLQGMKKDAAQSERAGGILMAETLAGTAEFACSDPDYVTSVCVDEDKLLALSLNQNFSKFWDVAGITVEKFYPVSAGKKICTRGNYPSCNVFVVVNQTAANTISDASYVLLCRQDFKNQYLYTQCDLGRLIVTTEKIA